MKDPISSPGLPSLSLRLSATYLFDAQALVLPYLVPALSLSVCVSPSLLPSLSLCLFCCLLPAPFSPPRRPAVNCPNVPMCKSSRPLHLTSPQFRGSYTSNDATWFPGIRPGAPGQPPDKITRAIRPVVSPFPLPSPFVFLSFLRFVSSNFTPRRATRYPHISPTESLSD